MMCLEKTCAHMLKIACQTEVIRHTWTECFLVRIR